MLVVTRYRVPDDAAGFAARGRAALAVLSSRPGCLSARLGRSVDEPELWTLTTTWSTVGDYRRALSNHEVKQVAVPLMYDAVDEATAYEELVTWEPGSGVQEFASDRAEG